MRSLIDAFTRLSRRNTTDSEPVHPPEHSPRAYVSVVCASWADASRADVEALLQIPAAQGWDEDETELAQEMLRGRLEALALEERLQRGDVPTVQTQHKAVAADTCHLVMPASTATDAGEAGGTLFLTARRLRFVGGRDVSLGWSTVRDVRSIDRDIIVTTVRGGAARFRCNSYGDAMAGATLSRFLRGRAGGPVGS